MYLKKKRGVCATRAVRVATMGSGVASTMQPTAHMPIPPPRAQGEDAVASLWRTFPGGARWSFCGDRSHGATRAKRGLRPGSCTVGPPFSGQSKSPHKKALMWPNLVGLRAEDHWGDGQTRKGHFPVALKGLRLYTRVFFLGGCVQGSCRVHHPKGVLSQTPY